MSKLILALPSKGRLMEQCNAALTGAGISIVRTGPARGYKGEIAGLPGVEVATGSLGQALSVGCGLASALNRLSHQNEHIPTDVNPAFNSLFIVAPLSGGGIGSWFSTHPPTEKRIAALLRMEQEMAAGHARFA